MDALQINAELFAGISAHASAETPNECCGILLGLATAAAISVSTFLPTANSEPADPAHRHSIAPADLILAQKNARLSGLSIIGFYHSHPEGPAQWSQADLDGAHWPGCAYLILGMKHGRVEAFNAFLLVARGPAERSFAPINVKIISN